MEKTISVKSLIFSMPAKIRMTMIANFNDAYMSENVAYQLEGFLFPATYDLAENSKASDVVTTMLETFDGKITDKWKAIVMKTVCRFMSL